MEDHMTQEKALEAQDVLRELARAKAVFQQRAIMAAMGVALPVPDGAATRTDTPPGAAG